MNTTARIAWRRILGQKLRRVTADEARATLAAHAKRGPGIGDPAIRELTGGVSSQAIDGYVLRRLGIIAGYIKAKP
jgi:hypothetical protein